MRVKVGQYMLGYRNVDLYANPDSCCGSFTLSPNIGPSAMEVGTDLDHFWEVLNILLHEAMEMALCEVSARYRPNPCFADSASDTYRFMFDHNQFTEASYRAAYFIAKSQYSLAKIHRKHVTARKKAARKKEK